METKTDCIAEEFGEKLDQIKAVRVDALAGAMDMQIMLRSLLQHEARRTEKKLGPEHPRAQRLRAWLQGNLKQINALAVERGRFRIEVPEVAEEGALVHGRVVDDDGRGIAGLVVCLVDARRVPIAGTGEPVTDASGYFAIVLDPESIDRLLRAHQAAVFLAVFTARGRLVYLPPKPLALARGARLLQEVPLNRRELLEGGSVRPPPGVAAVTVPELVGKPEDEAIKSLKESNLEPGTRKTRAAPDQVGLVLEQEPAAGTKVAAGSAVSLVIGVTQQVEVPDLTGQQLDAAVSIIRQLNLAVGRIERRPDGRKDVVLEQKPAPGTSVTAGTPIDLVVGEEGKGSELRAKIAVSFAQDSRFEALGVSERVLLTRFEEQDLSAVPQFEALLALSDRDLRDTMRLPNLRSAQIFKEILKRVLEQH